MVFKACVLILIVSMFVFVVVVPEIAQRILFFTLGIVKICITVYVFWLSSCVRNNAKRLNSIMWSIILANEFGHKHRSVCLSPEFVQ